jgi:hypothetical protein
MGTSVRDRVTAGFGIAAAPGTRDSRLEKMKRRALGVLPATATVEEDALDEGSEWAFALSGCGARLGYLTDSRVRLAVAGGRLEMREDSNTKHYRPVLVLPKIARSWPTRVDCAIVLAMVGAVLLFLFATYREHLFDLHHVHEARD